MFNEWRSLCKTGTNTEETTEDIFGYDGHVRLQSQSFNLLDV